MNGFLRTIFMIGFGVVLIHECINKEGNEEGRGCEGDEETAASVENEKRERIVAYVDKLIRPDTTTRPAVFECDNCAAEFTCGRYTSHRFRGDFAVVLVPPQPSQIMSIYSPNNSGKPGALLREIGAVAVDLRPGGKMRCPFCGRFVRIPSIECWRGELNEFWYTHKWDEWWSKPDTERGSYYDYDKIIGSRKISWENT